MPGFAKPPFPYTVDVAREGTALQAHPLTRGIPSREAGHVLIAMSNIATLGAKEQPRDAACLELLAESVASFDVGVANTEADLEQWGVFDFDAVDFADLWRQRTRRDFNEYGIWALSDRRPLWAQLAAPN